MPLPRYQGRSQDFSKEGSQRLLTTPDCLVDLHTVHVLLNAKKTNFKKVGFSTMAFTAFTAFNIFNCFYRVRIAECFSETGRPF